VAGIAHPSGLFYAMIWYNTQYEMSEIAFVMIGFAELIDLR
jgi:hypothetical protein